ncbi:MAG: DUF4870 domain-containing protein [Roseibium sp.]
MNQQSDVDGYLDAGGKNVTLIYILYLVGFLIGLTPLIGVIFAYINRGKAAGWVDSHYTFQIRTFWISVIGSIVGVVLTFVLIGFLVLLALAIWVIIRCVKGLQLAARGEAVPDPETWTF